MAFIFALTFLLPLTCIKADGIGDLQKGFERPPDNARIMMRWWWFGPAVTKAELEREMRLMKEGGIGGFEVQPTYPLLPDAPAGGIRNLPFLSDDFLDALRFTSTKARELGLRMDLTLGSGWPFGGAQVSIEDAAGMLRTERVRVEAGTRRVPLPSMTAGEKLLAVFLAHTEWQTIAPDSLREITDIKDDALTLPGNLNNANELLFFISSRTGMQVKRPALGAEGYVLNHMDRGATDNYLKNVGDRLLSAFGSHPPHAIFCDSLEAYNHDWTSDLPEEFKKRRGYDLKPYLPALVADIGPKTAAIRYDWGRTLTELLNERFLAPLHDWSKRNHTLFRIQNYGVPAAALSSNAYVDLPEGEGPQWKILRASRWASSASHLYGQQVTSSETWTWLHSPVFRATPLDIKAEADLHFLEGINQLIGHGWPYTPESVEYPGWRFYASGVFNEKNPWWIVMPDVSLYLQRVSYMMRQGQPANDVALYLPNSDAYAGFYAGHDHMIESLRDLIGTDVISTTLEAGYNFDFFDDDSLAKIGRVEKDALVLGQNKYKVVILPNVERMPLATLRKLEELARGGGIVIATRRRPQIAPGLLATDTEQQQLNEISRRMFEGANASAHLVPDDKAHLGMKLVSLLRRDVEFTQFDSREIGFIHRKAADAEIYFVANTSNVRRNVQATFRVEGLEPELWDAFTGKIQPAQIKTGAAGGTTIALDLEPYGSRLVVFSKRTRKQFATRSSVNSTSSSNAPTLLDLSNNWRVTFGQNTEPVVMESLRSWTEADETRYFSGVATYEKTITVPAALLQDGHALRLDFGEGTATEPQPLKAGMQAWLDAPVRDAAVVYINDRRVGSVWCPPYSLDVTGFLRSGENRIRIMVGNLALNYMAGRRLPDYRLLNLRYGERFQAQDMDKVQPVAAGLLSKIRLIGNADSK